MSKRSVKKMILDLGDLNITKEEVEQAYEIKIAVESAILPVCPKIHFENVMLWWLICEPADA